MPRRALEAIAPRDIRQLGPVELSDGGDDGADLDVLALTVASLKRDVPRLLVFGVAGTGHLGGKADMRANPERIGEAIEIGKEFVAAREVMRPSVVGFEGERVEVVGRVQPRMAALLLAPRRTLCIFQSPHRYVRDSPA